MTAAGAVAVLSTSAVPALASTGDGALQRSQATTGEAMVGEVTSSVVVGNLTGGDVSSQPTVNSRQALDKLALSQAYYRAKYLGGSLSTFSLMNSSYGRRYPSKVAAPAFSGITTSSPARSAFARTSESSSSLMLATATATSRSLSVTQVGQSKSYYCGPASGYILAKYKGKTKGAYNNASLSQGALATSSYMATDANGGTSWSSNRWKTGVNRWLEGHDYGYYIDVHAPAPSQMGAIMVHSIDNSMPLGADTVELAGGYHYNGHPNKTIGHWIVGYGYTSSGGTSKFADPSTSVWSTVSPYFAYSSSTFASRFLQSNGIVY
jgi:hypothetical protein